MIKFKELEWHVKIIFFKEKKKKKEKTLDPLKIINIKMKYNNNMGYECTEMIYFKI